MQDEPAILLTNDDGIDAPGLEALYERLSQLGTVRVVAPTRDQSGSGRSLTINRSRERSAGTTVEFDADAGQFSYEISHEMHEFGYALDATPCDCVILGIHAFETPDLVVSGCNLGLNLGGHVMTRSGTVSAAIEAAIAGVPSVAVSMDYPRNRETPHPENFAPAATVTADLLHHALETDLFERIDYLNVNVPDPESHIAGAELTRPSEEYPLEGVGDEGQFEIRARSFDRAAPSLDAAEAGTDRHAVMRSQVSVSPLAVPRTPTTAPELDGFVEQFEASPPEGTTRSPLLGE